MNEVFLMKIITGFLIIVFLFMYIFPKFNLKFTKGSFKGFSSLSEFLNYFRFAFSFTLKNKFVFLFPFVFVISLNLFSTVMFYLARINYKDTIIDKEFTFNIYKYFNSWYILGSLKDIDYGFYDFAIIIDLVPIFLVSLLVIIYYSFFRRTNKLDINHIDKISKYSKLYLIFLIPNILMLFLIYLGNVQLTKIFTVILSISIIILLCLDILFAILIQTAIELTILLFVVSKLKNNELNLNSLKDYLAYIKPLFLLNILLNFGFKLIISLWNIPTIITFVGSLDRGIKNILLDYTYLFIGYMNYLNYICVLFYVILFPAVFILIYNKYNFTSTIQNTIKFVLDNFVKYILFIISGIMLMYISSLLYAIPSELIGRLSHFQPILMILSGCIKLFIAVIFYIALFKFYIDTEQSDGKAVI